jgi:osmotically-inducible protein OsmY
MADRYEYDRERYGSERGYGRDYDRERNRMREGERHDEGWRHGRGDERGMMERARDEVRSWFGDEEAARRRRPEESHEAQEYGGRDWARERGYGRERGYAGGEDIDRSSRAYSTPGRQWEPRDYDRPDWGWGGSEGAQRSWTDRSRQTQSRTAEWGTPRDWGTPRGEERWITGGYSSALFAWAEPGPYTGRGPRGYQRSDERIREDICDRLTRHGRIDATDIQIQVRNGEVTLDGAVDSREAKRLAEDVAESVDGVRDVVNHLKSHRGDESAVTSRTITTGKEQK